MTGGHNTLNAYNARCRRANHRRGDVVAMHRVRPDFAEHSDQSPNAIERGHDRIGVNRHAVLTQLFANDAFAGQAMDGNLVA